MLSDHHLLANLQALARAGTPAPSLGRVDANDLRVAESNGTLVVAIRAADERWIQFGADDVAETSAIASEVTTVCLIGTRTGHMLDAVWAHRPDIRIVALEPEPSHALILLSQRDWSEAIASGRLLLFVGPQYPGASPSSRRLDGATTPPVLTDPILAKHRSQATRQAGAVAERMIAEARANYQARVAFAPRYLLQTLQNLPVIAREGDAASLDQSFVNVPAIIVGAGPSLDDNLAALREWSDRALVIAADTALAPLRHAGITPPLVVAVDPSEWNARHLVTPAVSGDSWLIGEGSLHPSAFPKFTGQTFTFEVSGHEPWPWFRAHGLSRGRLRAWGSVVTSAFDLALRMGCDPIVFTGLDLAFTGGRTYCRHTAHEEIWGKWIENGDTWENVWSFLVSQQPQQTATDLRGKPAITSPYLVAFANWLIEQIAAAPAHHRFANVTGAGLLHGARIEQTSLPEMLGTAPRLTSASVRERLTSAHRLRVPPEQFCRKLGKATLEAARELSRPGSALEERWRHFTAGSLDAARTSTTLSTAAESFAS